MPLVALNPRAQLVSFYIDSALQVLFSNHRLRPSPQHFLREHFIYYPCQASIISCTLNPLPSYPPNPPMHRTPNPPHTLILTHHLPAPNPFILRPTIPQQQLSLLQHLLLFQILHADGFFAPVDIERAQHGVFVWTRGDAELDGGVGVREGGEEGGGEEFVETGGGAGPVAVVEVEAAAGEDEGADAVLVRVSQ